MPSASSTDPDSMTPGESSATPRPATEEWFLDHGLPYFVVDIRQTVARRLSAPRMFPAILGSVLTGALVVWLLSLDSGLTALDWFLGGVQISALILLGYCWVALRLGTIIGWAVRRTLDSLGLLLPLATRALPLLLLFITFLFINTEVWQVASRLDRRTLWLTVTIFAATAALFLVARLPEELEGHTQSLQADQIRLDCQGTPFEGIAQSTSDEELDDDDDIVIGLERANLILVLVIAQFVQVLLLSAVVFVFFLGFGVTVMHPDVVRAWLGSAGTLHPILGVERLSVELIKVATFLASFTGLYFTVYAVSAGEYREQFFSQILRELRLAISARAAYRVGQPRTPGRDKSAG